jgi:UMF1 family MFS transporter
MIYFEIQNIFLILGICAIIYEVDKKTEWRDYMFKLLKLSKKERAWVLYDIANSAFILTVITILFPILYNEVYMSQAGADWTTGSAIFKYLTSALALTVALLSPVIGAWSNYRGNKKKFFKIFLIIGIVGGFGIAIPGLDWLLLLIIFSISSIGYNLTNVVYDAFLVDVTPHEKMDEISATGFAWGYIGSLVPFFFGMIPYFLVTFGILDESLGHLAISFAFIVAVAWWLYYSLPILRDVEQTYNIDSDGDENTLLKSLKRLGKTFKDIRAYRYIFLFLIAYLLYIDVVNTVIRLAVNIGTDLNVSAPVLLGVVVMVQFIGFPSAIIYGRLTKRFGGKKMIFYGILVYSLSIYVTSLIVSAETTYLMWIVGLLIGTAQGGIQSVSRSYFAKMVPKEKANDFFGFFSVFGRFGGIISPFILASLAVYYNKPTNEAILFLLVPMFVASIILLFVKPEQAEYVE